MASLTKPMAAPRATGPIILAWAFVERQKNLWKRYWAWELVWLVYGVVNTLAITFIAREVEQAGIVGAGGANDLVLFLLLGTLVWAYLSAVLDDISLVITWERWEGTIEHTLMAPVPRWVHLVGMSVFGVMHAIVRTLLIFAIALPFFAVDFSQADWLAAVVVMAVGSVSIAGIGILAGDADAAISGARHADVVHGAGSHSADFRSLLQRRGAARVVAVPVIPLARHVPPGRHPRGDHRG